MTTLQQIDVTCPVCDTVTRTHAVISTNSFGGKRTDFHERAAGTQPLPYLVHVCRGCGFTGAERDFAEGRAFVGPAFRAQMPTAWAAHTCPLAGSEKYERAAVCARLAGADTRQQADLWLRAAWCCVDEGDVEAERYFRRIAARAFADALGEFDTVEPRERAVVTYLVGELWRRVGDQKAALAWFASVPGEVVNEYEQQWIVDAARQQSGPQPRQWFG